MNLKTVNDTRWLNIYLRMEDVVTDRKVKLYSHLYLTIGLFIIGNPRSNPHHLHSYLTVFAFKWVVFRCYVFVFGLSDHFLHRLCRVHYSVLCVYGQHPRLDQSDFRFIFLFFDSCWLSEFSSLVGRWTGPRGSRTPNVKNGNRKWSNLYNSFQNEIIKVTYGSLTAKSATFGLSVCPPPPSRAIRLIFQLACKSEPPINIHLSGGKVYTTLSNATNKSVAQISSPPRLPWRDTMAPLGVNVFHSTIKKQ